MLPDPAGASDIVDALTLDAVGALTETGRVAVLLGPAGAGKSEIAAIFRKAITRTHKTAQVVFVDCAQGAGHDVWARLVHELTFDDKLKATGSRLARTWVSLIPLVGPIISAAANTLEHLRKRDVPTQDQDQQRTAAAIVADLLKYHPLEQRCIIADHVENADASFVAGAAALQRRLSETRTFMLLVIQTDAAGRMPDSLSDFVLEAERAGLCRRFSREPAVGAAIDLDQLSPQQQHLLQLAAACPKMFYSVVLAELTGLDELLVEDQLAALTRAGVLRHHPLPAELQLLTSQHSFSNEESRNRLLSYLSEPDRIRAEMTGEVIAERLGLSGFNSIK